MKYGKKRLFLPAFFVCITVASFFVFKVLAQVTPNYDVTVSPVYFDLSTNPGTTVSDKVRIRNNTTSPLPIRIVIKKLTGDVNGDLTLRDTSSDDSLSWIRFTSPTFVAKPLEWTDVPFSIAVPKEAAYGYYFAISFSQDNSSPLARTGAKITGAAAVPILLNVRKEGAKAIIELVDFKTKSYVNDYLPIDFTVKVKNNGNVHVSPHGSIFISSATGKDIAILDVNSAVSKIIPGTNRSFEVLWNDGFLVRENVLIDGQKKLDKNGNSVQELKINWDKLTSFRFGKYTANLLLVFDNGTRDVSLESTTSFWVIPYKAIIVILVSLLILIAIVVYVLRLYVRRQIEKNLKKRGS